VTGSALGALVAGLLAQWRPLSEVLPFVVHIAVTVPFLVLVSRAAETSTRGGVAGPWWRQLRIPAASHRRFVRVVVVACPWIFAGAAIGYGYLPTRLAGTTGEWGLVFATAATVTALTVSSVLQPVGRRIHSASSARGLGTMVLVIAVGIALVYVAIRTQSVGIGLAANVVIGFGMGTGLVSGVQEVQRIAGPRDLAGLTGVFYAVAYVGFLAPLAIAAAHALAPVTVIFAVLVVLALASWAVVTVSSKKHLPA
jgi:hypothetical protein